ncbi:hypothetical protein ACFL5O_05425 [Myxococcota bacterium]
MTRLTSITLAWSLSLAFLLGCSTRTGSEPQVASGAGETGYASRYPTELGAARGGLQTHESDLKMLTGKFPSYPNELQDPSWPHVLGVVERADRAGRAQTYVQRAGESRVVERFFEEEKPELTRKVGGAAQYAAAQKGCKDADAYSAAAYALDKSVKKQLQERLRERNEAHLYLEDNQEALGKKNLPNLEKQADEIAYSSYIAHVASVEVKVRLKAMLAQDQEVRATLDRTISETQSVASDPNRSEADRKAAQKRLEAAQAGKQGLDTEVQQADRVLKNIDERIRVMQEAYSQALESLHEAIGSKSRGP